MPKSPPRYGTIEAAAELLAVTPRTIRNRISDGSLTGYRLGKRAIRVDLDEVESLLRPIPTAGAA